MALTNSPATGPHLSPSPAPARKHACPPAGPERSCPLELLHPQQHFSHSGPWTSSSGSLWKLLRKTHSWAPLRTYRARNLGAGGQQSASLHVIQLHLNLGNHGSQCYSEDTSRQSSPLESHSHPTQRNTLAVQSAWRKRFSDSSSRAFPSPTPG